VLRVKQKQSKNGEGKQEDVPPYVCLSAIQNKFPIFSLFTPVFRISKQWKLAAGVGKRESCVLSVGKFLFVQTTWSFPPGRN